MPWGHLTGSASASSFLVPSTSRAIRGSMWKSPLTLSTPQFLGFLNTNVYGSHLDQTLEIGPSGDFESCWHQYLTVCSHVQEEKEISYCTLCSACQCPAGKEKTTRTYLLLTCWVYYSLQLRGVCTMGCLSKVLEPIIRFGLWLGIEEGPRKRSFALNWVLSGIRYNSMILCRRVSLIISLLCSISSGSFSSSIMNRAECLFCMPSSIIKIFFRE